MPTGSLLSDTASPFPCGAHSLLEGAGHKALGHSSFQTVTSVLKKVKREDVLERRERARQMECVCVYVFCRGLLERVVGDVLSAEVTLKTQMEQRSQPRDHKTERTASAKAPRQENTWCV